jgi:nicotinate phosphoribosyltransferase
MAHSYIQAHEDEFAAFEGFVSLYPDTTLLVDTYDTLEGVRKVIELSHKLGERFRVRAVRLDSGDLANLAVGTRKMLDEGGLRDIRIFASSGLDEYKVQALVESGAPIDAIWRRN